MRTKELKRNKGVTLIALVITIIVLLILAGVSIATLVGDNGILIKIQEAKNSTEEAERDEKINLSKTEDLINQYIDEIEQVTDKNPGVLEGTGTDIDPYVINSIEDLVFFSYDVTNGNTYEGQKVKLGLSLDFNSNKSYVEPLRTDYGIYGYNGELKTLLMSGEGFKPIGTIYDTDISTNYFKGNFDGNARSIYNIYQNIENSEYVTIAGLFSTNEGTIRNLSIKNIDINGITNDSYLLYGGVVGRNKGTIEQCSTSGEIRVQANGVKSVYIGGIAGQYISTDSIINQCSSNVKINVSSTNANSLNVSGIGQSYETKNSYFIGKILIEGESKGIKNIGGIGFCEESIINCYNAGNIDIYFDNDNEGDVYVSGITLRWNSLNKKLL